MEIAESLLKDGQYDEAYSQFEALQGAEKAKGEVVKAMHSVAVSYLDTEEYEKALALLEEMKQYADDSGLVEEAALMGNAIHRKVQQNAAAGEYDTIEPLLSLIGTLPDGADLSEAEAQTSESLYQAVERDIKERNAVNASKVYDIWIQMNTEEAKKEALRTVIYETAEQCVRTGYRSDANALRNLMGKVEMQVYCIPEKEQQLKIAAADIGDTVMWGDGLEWVVLDRKDNGEILLFSKYYVKVAPPEDYDKSTWEDSGVRRWLNQEFIKQLDTSMIVETTLKNEWLTEGHFSALLGGKNIRYEEIYRSNTVKIINLPETKDNVFLLSVEEMERYKGTILLHGKHEELPSLKSGYENEALMPVLLRTSERRYMTGDGVENYDYIYSSNYYSPKKEWIENQKIYYGYESRKGAYICPAVWIKSPLG